MKYACIAAAIAFVVGAHACHAQEGVDKAKATAFDTRMFGGPLSQKTYACFVRRYDASNDLVAGDDDKIFRVDRADLHECSELVTGRKELAALRHK
jgi:hypothetical protein